ncbi:MAG: 2-oxo acid dehydrogenase subunit E2 [Sphaerochaetaceae bacterium]
MAIKKILVPHIGDFSDVAIIEVYVKEGDKVEADDSLIALESAKAVTDIPSPYGGTITKVTVKEGDLVSEGSLIAEIETEEEEEEVKEVKVEAKPVEEKPPEEAKPIKEKQPQPPVVSTTAHATPALRKYARELGVDISRVAGSGPHGRILHSDVQSLVKQALSGTPQRGAFKLEDFSLYGEIERVPLTRIQRLSGPHLSSAWQSIPHVTQADQADVTELEKFRKNLKSEVKLSILPFVIKALPYALQKYPALNASFDEESSQIILKRYYNIGVAVDTEEGLVVPVVKNVDSKGVIEIAEELIALSERARTRKLSTEDLSGASFSVSSLGGIGGTYFTPIINRPEVAILGLSRITKQPLWNGEGFEPRDILPLSLSYDHRVVDGAVGVRFTVYLATLLNDLRRTIL